MSNRYVPFVTGVISFSAGVALAVFVREWWTFVLGPFLLYYGWVSLKIGFQASDEEIEELTTPNSRIDSAEQTLDSLPDKALRDMQIHPDDAHLVRAADMEWFTSQTADILNTLSEQDTSSVIAAIKHNAEELNLDEKEAAHQAFRALPIYHKDLDDRENDPFGIGKLPLCIKDRVNRGISVIAECGREGIDSAGSVNQLVRQLIIAGRV